MTSIEFTPARYTGLLEGSFKFVELVATGKEVQTSEDYYKKEIILRAYKLMPVRSIHYVMPVDDDELRELATGSDTDIVYIEYT